VAWNDCGIVLALPASRASWWFFLAASTKVEPRGRRRQRCVLAAADDILAINDTLTAQYDGTGPKVVETTASSTTGSIWVVCLGPGRMTVRADEAGVSSTSTYRRCDGRPAGALGGIDADYPDTMWRIFVVGTDISWRG
jgi:hypothetical protein